MLYSQGVTRILNHVPLTLRVILSQEEPQCYRFRY